jgi:hypothetical protein
MNKKHIYILIGLHFICADMTFGQASPFWKSFGNTLTFGVGGLATGDASSPFEIVFLNTKISLAVTKKVHIGFRNFEIWERRSTINEKRFRIRGAYAQWDVYRTNFLYISAEIGYYFGNYCTCNQLYANVRPRSNVLLPGVGTEFRLFNKFYFELSVRRGFYLPRIENTDIGNFGLLVNVGINYRLRLKK